MRFIALTLAVLGFVLSGCESNTIEQSGAEANYLNDCRPYDLLLKDLLGTLSSVKVKELISESDELGMTVPVDEALLGAIDARVEKLRLFNLTAPENLAELGKERATAYDSAIAAADILSDAKDAYEALVLEYEGGTMDRVTRQENVREIMDTYSDAVADLQSAEEALPKLLASVNEKP
jgi:hypothetical protein